MDGIPGVESGYISSPKDVFEAVKYYFENNDKRVCTQGDTANKIEKFKFFSYMMDTNPIQRPDEEFKSLVDISKNYQFVVNGKCIVCMRNCSCWCLYCMKAMMGTSVGWKESHTVANCSDSENETTKVYEFLKSM